MCVSGAAGSGKSALLRQLGPHFVARGVEIALAAAEPGKAPDARFDEGRVRGDVWVGVVDASPRRGFNGAGDAEVVECDLLVIDKTDVAAGSADLMDVIADMARARSGRPWLLTDCATGEGVVAVVDWLLMAVREGASRSLSPQRSET